MKLQKTILFYRTPLRKRLGVSGKVAKKKTRQKQTIWKEEIKKGHGERMKELGKKSEKRIKIMRKLFHVVHSLSLIHI